MWFLLDLYWPSDEDETHEGYWRTHGTRIESEAQLHEELSRLARLAPRMVRLMDPNGGDLGIAIGGKHVAMHWMSFPPILSNMLAINPNPVTDEDEYFSVEGHATTVGAERLFPAEQGIELVLSYYRHGKLPNSIPWEGPGVEEYFGPTDSDSTPTTPTVVTNPFQKGDKVTTQPSGQDVLRRIARSQLEQYLEDLHDPLKEDLADSLVRQWVANDGHAGLITRDSRLWFQLVPQKDGGYEVSVDADPHRFMADLRRANLNEKEIPELLHRLNLSQSVVCRTADGRSIRLQMNPKKKAFAIEDAPHG
jgi:hypothetical protein